MVENYPRIIDEERVNEARSVVKKLDPNYLKILEVLGWQLGIKAECWNDGNISVQVLGSMLENKKEAYTYDTIMTFYGSEKNNDVPNTLIHELGHMLDNTLYHLENLQSKIQFNKNGQIVIQEKLIEDWVLGLFTDQSNKFISNSSEFKKLLG